MAVSKAQQRAVNKYVKNNYDEIKLRMPKGKKEIIQAHAAQRGESVNAYINRAIDKAMSEDDSSTRPKSSPANTSEGKGYRVLGRISPTLQPSARSSFTAERAMRPQMP